jgi:large subunit ribosomal protein MRP49
MREMLPRLKYRNPAVPMTVSRKGFENEDPAVMTVWFRHPDATPSTSTPLKLFKGQLQPNATPPSESFSVPLPSESDPSVTSTLSGAVRKVVIDMKHKEESMILDELMKLTQARPVEPTRTETEEVQALEEQKARSRVDSERMAEINRKRK